MQCTVATSNRVDSHDPANCMAKKKRVIIWMVDAGNIEIFHNAKWGNVCDDEWDHREGHVLCRQLGFQSVQKVTHSGYFGVATRKYLLQAYQLPQLSARHGSQAPQNFST